MKKLFYTVLFCSCLFLMGCPLQTESPIQSDAAVSIPSWMPGRWTQLKDGIPAGTSYQIKPDPARPDKLQVITIDDSGQPDKSSIRPAVLSTVKGQLFLSVFDKGDETSDEGYYHYAVGRSSSGDLQLVPLKEHIVSSDVSGEELAAFIAVHTSADDYLEQKDIERYKRQP